MFNILIIEDDQKLLEMMKETLQRYGYIVSYIEDFKNIEKEFEQKSPDLILLDINLPYYDGFYLCRLFRRNSKAPIIITSARNGDMEQVMGIELGADDYVTKPFSLEFLLAKIKASLRRAYGEYSNNDGTNISFKGISVDDSSFKLNYLGKTIELSKNEFKLIKKLLEKRDIIVSREDLLAELWDDSAFVDDNTLTVNVTRAKLRLAELGLNDVIKTKRGSGYLFDSTVLDGVDSE